MSNPTMNAYLAQAIQASQPDDNSMRTGEVFSIDGTTLGILVNGGVVPCGYLSIWTPQVGETVALIRQGADWFVLGPTAGPASPPETPTSSSTGQVVGSAYFTGGTTASSAGAENIFTAWTATTGFSFEPAQIYRWDYAFGFYDNAGTAHMCDMRIRKTFTTASQQLGIWRRNTTPGFNGIVGMSNAWGHIKNETSGIVSADLAPSMARASGAGSVAYYGDANYICVLTLRHLGRAADHPVLTATAYAIT